MEQDKYHLMATLEDRHWWYVARRRILDRAIRRRVGGKPGRILEIGCGTGGNFGFLSRLGPLKACETNDEARRLAVAKSAVEVGGGHLPDQPPFAAEMFDLICMFDVLEHIDDDRGALAAVRDKLSAGGHLVLTVPAYMWLWSHHDDLHHHKRRYTLGRLTALVRDAGFELVHGSYFNTLLLPLVAAVRVMQRLLRLQNTNDFAMPSDLVNRVLGAVFAFERLIVPQLRVPFGVSVLVVARRAGGEATAPAGTA